MRKLIAAMKVSADGKFQGPEGYADWVEGWSEDYGLTERIDACLLGGRMYPGYEQYWSAISSAPDQPLPMTGRLASAAEIQWSRFAAMTPHFVLSSTLGAVDWTHTRVIRGVDEVVELKKAPGKDIYLMGGATLTSTLIDAGLVDEIHFITYPLLCGPGPGLFDSLRSRHTMELLGVRALHGGRYGTSYAIGAAS